MKENLKTLVGRKIRQLRVEKGLTIEELAFRAGVHPNYLGDIERGKRNPSIINLEKIANALRKPPGKIFQPADKFQSILSREKTPVYSVEKQDKNVVSFLKTLSGNSEKDRRYVIRIAKSLSQRLKRV